MTCRIPPSRQHCAADRETSRLGGKKERREITDLSRERGTLHVKLSQTNLGGHDKVLDQKIQKQGSQEKPKQDYEGK